MSGGAMAFPGGVRSVCGKLGSTLLVVASACAFAAAAQAAPLTFAVNSPADVPDVIPGNGVCETVAGNGVCTLRGAIQESNAHVGADTIILQPNVTYLLARVGDDETALNGDLDILDSVTITGAGLTTIIDGNGGALGERVFTIYKCIRELSPDSGICANGGVAAVMSGLTIQHGYSAGTVSFGGGIYSEASLTLQDCIVTASTVNGLNDWGGGVANFGSLVMTGCVVSNNISGGHNAYGGGIYNEGPMTIDSSTISGNVVSGSSGRGGGIVSSGGSKVVIGNSTVSSNSAAFGGGIYLSGTNAAVLNSTISGNGSDGDGGGVYFANGPNGLYNVTIAQNAANANAERGSAAGGGVFINAGATLYAANSIVAGNVALIPTAGKPINDPDQCSGTISSLGNNLLSDIDVSHCTVAGPYNVASLPLGPLQYNGGPTKTHALPSGSPAINAGNMAGCVDGDGAPIKTDQRGVHRPFGSYCDVGAFEASDSIFLNSFEIGV